MRGKVKTEIKQLKVNGITPAHAGKSKSFKGFSAFVQDHPRTCGEKLKCYLSHCLQLGSPPHMRGKVKGHQVQGLKARITPAHAGKRPLKVYTTSTSRDHPRTCGEKVIVLLVLPFSVWITPAHAGKSRSIESNAYASRDHPRTCGEKFSLVFCVFIA